MGRLLLILRLAICFSLVLPFHVLAATYYVGQAATGAGTGTSISNLCGGLADTDCTPSAGDTIYLCGSFTTQLAPQAVNGTASSVITYDFNCDNNPALLTFNGSADRGVFIQNRSYLTVNNARVTGITGTGVFDSALIEVLTSSNIILNSPTAYNNTSASGAEGIVVRSGTDVTLNNATAYGNYGHGIWIINTSTRVEVNGFLTYNNRRVGVKFEGNATQNTMTYSSAHDGVTYGNGDGCYAVIGDHISFYDITSYSNTNVLSDGEGYGCAIQQVTNSHVYLVTAHDNRSDGIEVWGNATLSSANCDVHSNIVYNHTGYADDSGSNGIEVRTGYSPGCSVVGNLAFNNDKNFRIGNDATGTSNLESNTAYGGIYSVRMVDSNEAGTNAVTGWTIKNNLFDTPSSDWIATDVTSGNSNTFAKNNFAGSKQATYNNVVYTAGTITTVDATATTTTPAYVGTDRTVSLNYRLAPASTLRRAGISSGYCIDNRGRVCWNPPDIGAYQASSGDQPTTRAPRVP